MVVFGEISFWLVIEIITLCPTLVGGLPVSVVLPPGG